MKMIVEKQMECRLAGETEILGENLPQRHFCPSQNSTWPDAGLKPGRRGGKPATNRLSYLLEVESTHSTIMQLEGLGQLKNSMTSSSPSLFMKWNWAQIEIL
jgi:hypothetical protein